MKVMKAISLWQPWASLMETGAKTIETRSWKTNYRGPLLICSAKGGITKNELSNLLADWVFQAGLSFEEENGVSEMLMPLRDRKKPTVDDLPFGKALCVVDLVDCVPTKDLNLRNYPLWEHNFGDYSPGRFAWITKYLRPIEHIPITGRQGLFNVPAEIQSQIKIIEAE